MDQAGSKRSKASFIEDYSQKAENEYLKMYYEQPKRLVERNERVLQLTGDMSGKNVLDLGCAIGTMALEAAKRGANAQGIDFTPKMIEECEKLATENGLENVSFKVGDVSETNYPPETFDLIIAADIVEHLYQDILEKTLVECYKALKPGGKLIIHTMPTLYSYIFKSIFLFAPLIPMTVLPAKMQDMILTAYFNTLIQWVYFLRYGKTFNQHVAQRRHCNPQTKDSLKTALGKAGFEVDYCELEEFGTDKDNPHYRLAKWLFRRCSHVDHHIVATCTKEA